MRDLAQKPPAGELVQRVVDRAERRGETDRPRFLVEHFRGEMPVAGAEDGASQIDPLTGRPDAGRLELATKEAVLDGVLCGGVHSRWSVFHGAGQPRAGERRIACYILQNGVRRKPGRMRRDGGVCRFTRRLSASSGRATRWRITGDAFAARRGPKSPRMRPNKVVPCWRRVRRRIGADSATVNAAAKTGRLAPGRDP